MKDIPEVNFHKKDDNPLSLEIISFKELRSIFEQPLNHNPFKPHRLKFNILLVIVKGKKGIHTIDFKEYPFEENSVILISKNQIHSFVDLPKNYEGFLLMFKEEVFLELGINYPFLINHFYQNELYNPVHTLKKKDFSSLLGVVQKIVQKISDKRKSVREEIVKSYVKILLLEIFSCREKRFEKINKNKKTSDFITFQTLVKENFALEKKVGFYANEMKITNRQLNNICREIINKTAKDYITSHVILEAKKNLVANSLTSKEIAYKLGFEEPTNFTKFFKTHTKILPSEFINDNKT